MRRALILCFSAALAACPGPGKNAGGSDASDGDRYPDGGLVPTDAGDRYPDGGLIPSVHVVRVGPRDLHLLPGEARSLTAFAVDPQGGTDGDGGTVPVGILGEIVSWTLSTADAGTEQQSTQTGATGVTHIDVGAPASSGSFAAHAKAANAINHADWSVSYGPAARHIRVIPNAPIITRTDPSTAAVVTIPNSEIALAVRVTEDFGAIERPVPGASVTYSFVSSVGGVSLADRSQTTGVSGRASAILTTGATIGAFKVIATSPGAGAATFNVSVIHQPQPCRLSSQCGTGYVCVAGQCGTPPASGCGSSDQMCPVGFGCSSGVCSPAGTQSCNQGRCPHGYSCDMGSGLCALDDPQCAVSGDCPTGGTCTDGLCLPITPSSTDVTGHWYTAHDFDISSALPGWLQLSAEMGATLDEIARGAIPSLPPNANALVQGFVSAYIPEWVPQLLTFLKTMADVFAHLRVFGEMDLAAVDAPDHLQVTENWKTLRFRSAALCPAGTTVDPANPPSCAVLDLETADLAEANFATTVHQATARLVGDQILFDRRSVDLQLAGIIYSAVNEVAGRSGYASLQGPPGHPEQGAFYNLIDCTELAEFVQDCGVPVDVTPACQDFVYSAADDLAQQLSNIVINTNALSFRGRATATQNRLGSENYETVSPADGSWDGRFVGLVDSVNGRWRASRAPLE